MHLFHKWTKWGKVITSYTGDKYQWRTCKDCNKVQLRKIKWDNQCSTDEVNQAIQETLSNDSK